MRMTAFTYWPAVVNVSFKANYIKYENSSSETLSVTGNEVEVSANEKWGY